MSRSSAATKPLEGEDLETSHWQDARHWLSIYADLLRFKTGLLDWVSRDLKRLPPAAQEAAAAEFEVIESQMAGYEARIALWYNRLFELDGLRVDPKARRVLFGGKEASLTERESELLQFLLAHPHRYYTAEQIVQQAWGDADLFPEEVRNYVQRLRRLIRQNRLPCDLSNRPGRGYALVYRESGEARKGRRGPAPLRVKR